MSLVSLNHVLNPRAYHELLNWLVAMENNKDERVKEAGRVLRWLFIYLSSTSII